MGSWVSQHGCLPSAYKVVGLIQVRIRSLKLVELCLVQHLLLHLVQVLHLFLVFELLDKSLPVLRLVDAFGESLLVISNKPFLLVVLHHFIVLHQLLIGLPSTRRLLPCLVIGHGV